MFVWYSTSSGRFCAAIVAIGILASGTNWSQAETPTVSYIYPAGAQRGTTTAFRIGGHFLHTRAALDMAGTGVDASSTIEEGPTTWFEGPLVVKPASQAAENYPRDHYGEIRVAADAPLGAIPWRVWTSQGATTGRPFVIGHLPEALENEADGRPQSQWVSLPITVNGRIFPREDVDLWTFDVAAGETVTCEVLASRIASPLDSSLEVRNPSGQVVAENGDHFGTDSWLRFVAKVSGTYELRIWDAEFRGLQDFVYRINLTAGAHVDRVYPLGGQQGQTVRLQLIGPQSPLEPVIVTLPESTIGPHRMTVPLANQATASVIVDVGEFPEITEGPGAADVELHLPVNITGAIERPGEVDRWRFVAQQGQVLEFELTTQRWGSSLDAMLQIFRESDFDSAPDKPLLQTGSVVDAPMEPKASFTAPETGTYVLTVRDALPDRGGSEFFYRLRIGPTPPPDFRLRLAADALTIPRGGEVKLKVAVERIGGFSGEVKLDFADLPPGIHALNTVIGEKAADTELVFKADTNAKVGGHFLRLRGLASIADKEVARWATVPPVPLAQPASTLLLAVAMPTPFKFDGGELQIRYGARGTVFRRNFAIQRNGFTGPLTVRLADRQIRHLQGVTGPTLKLAADVDEFEYPVSLPTWLETNRTSRSILMVTGVVNDEDGTAHTVSFSSPDTRNQIALLTAPCPMNIRTSRQTVRAVRGGSEELEITVLRGTLIPAEVRIKLIDPGHNHGVTAQPLCLSSNESTGRLQLRFGEQLTPFHLPLVIRATTFPVRGNPDGGTPSAGDVSAGDLSEGDPVIAECSLEIVVPTPSLKAP